jgi:ElaB/YqjD/DUF883 family membrane-anchored ribosome-binding protein
MDTTTTTSRPAPTRAASDSIASHLQALADEAEALLKATARAGDEQVHTARARLADELHHLQERLADLEGRAATRIRATAHRTDEAAHAHPYAGMGAAAAVGLLLGFVLGRR